MPSFPRAEIEKAYRAFVDAGDRGDWDAWADLHSEDGVWVEHNFGTLRGREEIRRVITRVMEPVPMMQFPVEWTVIEGNRIVYYPWQVFPDPQGGDAVYRFGCVTILEYAGDGLFSYQEDVYNPREGDETIRRWVAAGGRFAAASLDSQAVVGRMLSHSSPPAMARDGVIAPHSSARIVKAFRSDRVAPGPPGIWKIEYGHAKAASTCPNWISVRPMSRIIGSPATDMLVRKE